MLHGCDIGNNSLIGINSVVLDGAKIGKKLPDWRKTPLITEGKEIPDGSLVMGSPGKVVRELSPEQIDFLQESALGYVNNARRFKKETVRRINIRDLFGYSGDSIRGTVYLIEAVRRWLWGIHLLQRLRVPPGCPRPPPACL